MQYDDDIQRVLLDYPPFISKEQFYQICHISKKTAQRLLEAGIVPVQCSGKKTRKYRIAIADVEAFLKKRAQNPETVDAWKKATVTASEMVSPEMQAQFAEWLLPYPDVLSVAEVSKITGYGTTSVANWCRKEYLHSFLIRRKFHIPQKSLMEFLMSDRFSQIQVKSAKHREALRKIEAPILPQKSKAENAELAKERQEKETMNPHIIALANQKGGVTKTTSCANLGIGLAMLGKRVLLADCDPQGSLTVSLGHPQPDELDVTLTDVLKKVLMDERVDPREGILHHEEGVDLMPANISLSGMEVSLVNAMSRETVLKQYLDTVKSRYDYILLDCMPSLGMLTINALAAADSVIIPVQAQYLPAKGLEQLLQTIGKVRRQINPKLKIDGILLAMVDNRTNYTKEIISLLRDTYGTKLKVFDTEIPHSVRAAEISAEGKSIYAHDPRGKVAEAYRNLTKEVLHIEKQRQKHKADLGR